MARLGAITNYAFDTLKMQGMKCVVGELQNGQALYTPPGWIVMDAATKDTQLIYGTRKSFFVRSSGALEALQAVRSLEGGDQGSKLGQVLKIRTESLKEQEASAEAAAAAKP